MFKNNGKKYALLIGNTYNNTLTSCKKDIYILEKILKSENYTTRIVCDCYPEKEITKFIQNIKLEKEDLLFIHFSGHGKLYGRKINELVRTKKDGKVRLYSSWVNPDNTLFCSCDMKKILSCINIKKIIIISDCCHSETFGDYDGTSEFLFIGTTNISGIARSYPQDLGAIAYIFNHFFLNNIEINLHNIKNHKILPISFIIKSKNGK